MTISSDPKQRKKQIAAIQPPPVKVGEDNTIAVKHGGYGFLTSGIVPCNKCLIKDECNEFKEDASCKIIEEFQVDKVKEIMDLSHIKPEDSTLAQMLARELAFQAIVAKYIARAGLFKETKNKQILDLQPVLRSYWISVNAATRMCDQLGLSPMSRARLKIGDSGFNLGEAIQEIQKEEAND